MTLNLDIAATRDELENTAQVVLPLQLVLTGAPMSVTMAYPVS